ncbi:MAG: CoA transferase [Acidiferrobacterales bacterium]|nr:CoA transferase [Acidiferrobacterales bacterium]
MSNLPLANIKVIEFSHMVMGPSAGMVLADLGAEVIKVEPIGGDKTRDLKGSGAGYFAMYNRNKRSICVDMKSTKGRDIVLDLVKEADVVIENFRTGALDKLGFGYKQLASVNERLIYMSAKGFLKGPYENRTALDEVAQMMGGLAYMTGPSGRPLRAGASVIDVMGGMFGVIGILAALLQRNINNTGQHITSSLFESTVFLMGQHMAQEVITGKAPDPMPERISAWAIYDVFDTANEEKLFVAVVSDTQWLKFCEKFNLTEFSKDESMQTNAQRIKQRKHILATVKAIFKDRNLPDLVVDLEDIGLPYAPINKPQDLVKDPHLTASDGLLDVVINEQKTAKLPALPIQYSDKRFGLKRSLPQIGQHTEEVMQALGYSSEQIAKIKDEKVIG